MIYKLPDLPYPYDALEPHFDARTMEIHLTKHHAGYVANLNKAIEGINLGDTPIEELLAEIHTLPDEAQTAVRNHGGGAREPLAVLDDPVRKRGRKAAR